MLWVVALLFTATVARPAEPASTNAAPAAPQAWPMHDMNRPAPRVVTPGAQFSQLAPPPSDAVVLFDGKDLSKFTSSNGGEPKWKVENGYMEVVGGSGSLWTKEKFADFQMHVEFATPASGAGSSQGRGNSGIKLNSLYEIEVLDSFENPTYADGAAGAIYGQTPPLVNPSKRPGEWQTYDIIFESPRWDEKGTLVKKANVTLIYNGVVVHHRRDIEGRTSANFRATYGTAHPPEMFIELQDHANPVRFRNIWVRRLGEYDKP